MHVVIFTGGTVRPGKALQVALTTADLMIAADSGATTARQYGYVPAIIVGDFDSLNPPALQQLQQQGSQLIQAPVEKNETDTELAIQVALEQGATAITLLGALGGTRFEHTIANILLLVGFETVPIRIIDGPSTCWLLRGAGRSLLSGQVGDLLSLFPLTADATGVQTRHLYYPLHNETLYFGKPRGVSNMLTQEQAEISLGTGLLLIIHTSSQELDTE